MDMKCIVVYSSQTGRTKKIAQAVASGLPEGTPCIPVEQLPSDMDRYDCVFLGCWADGEQVDAGVIPVLHHLTNKHIALFITVQSGPFSDDSSKILRTVIDRLPPGIHVDGTYIAATEKDRSREEEEKELTFARTFAEHTISHLRAV